MKNLMVMMLITLLSVSCGKSGGSSGGSTTAAPTATVDQTGIDAGLDSETETPDPSPATPPAPTSSLPALALSFSTDIELMNFTSTQAAKYKRAIAIVKKVVATEKFRSKVLAHMYNGTKSFANNNGKTNKQIYQSILDAAEKLTPAKNNTMDLGVKLYYADNSVVGYTNPSIDYINVNRKFFNQYEENEVAGNLFHEWLHKLGYGHDAESTTRRPYSVPYAIGYMIREIGKSFI